MYRQQPRQKIGLLLQGLVAVVWTVWWGAGLQCSAAGENLWLDVARSSITNVELKDHVSVLADDTLEGREAGTRGGRAAAKYVLRRLEDAQLRPAGSGGRFVQPFHGNFQNLLAVLEGSDPELRDEYVVVGAHYDHVGYGTRRNSYGPIGFIHNGADDNASGVATLLEMIDALTHTIYRPRRSILFAFWDAEEKGLLGSQHWVRQPTVPLEAVRIALNIDMVGRLRKGRVEVGGARSGVGLRRWMSSPRLAEGMWLDFHWEYKDNSDHWSFFEAGIPSLYVHTGLHEDYHRPSDDIEKLNIEGMRQVGRYLLEQLCELADADQLPAFRRSARLETPQTQRREEKPLPPLAPRVGFTWQYLAGHPARVLVKTVRHGTTAAQAGLRVGDQIVAVNGLPITSDTLLPAVLLRSDSPITLQLNRLGADEPLSVALPLTGSPVRLGLSWREDAIEPGSVYITRVVPYSPAARAGIQLFDRIDALNGESFQGQDDLLARVGALLADDAPTIRFEIESRGKIHEVAVSMQLPSAEPGDPTL